MPCLHPSDPLPLLNMQGTAQGCFIRCLVIRLAGPLRKLGLDVSLRELQGGMARCAKVLRDGPDAGRTQEFLRLTDKITREPMRPTKPTKPKSSGASTGSEIPKHRKKRKKTRNKWTLKWTRRDGKKDPGIVLIWMLSEKFDTERKARDAYASWEAGRGFQGGCHPSSRYTCEIIPPNARAMPRPQDSDESPTD